MGQWVKWINHFQHWQRLHSNYGAPFVAKLYPLIGDPKAINRLSFCQKSSWFLSKIDSVFIVAKIESVFVLK